MAAPDARLAVLEQALDYGFSDGRLLGQALVHRSFGEPHNERLEFLGDSVLNAVIAADLYRRFDGLKEGDLSRLRASLVRQEGLHQVASRLKLGEHLKLGEGEMKSGGHRRPSILADALEAVFGAIFLDGGYDAAQRVILALYAPSLTALSPATVTKDPKTTLQEWLQARRRKVPTYSLAAVAGEAHAQEFSVSCIVESFGVSALGRGPSRRVAEQQAAAEVLKQLEMRFS
ncbi:MAG: ribonuclease III [Zoogloeaceae bacterium]|nr:ribonuclease III [Zoogloeaceae bacterium]